MKIRPVEKRDLAKVCSLIHELATFEKLGDLCKITEVDLMRAFFSPEENSPGCIVLTTETDIVGYAIYFYNFSTFTGRKGLYLEDLYVHPDHRRRGYGRDVLTYLAKIALDQNCSRFEWSVLDWNQSAIDFYKSLGAQAMDEWTVFRLSGNYLEKLAKGYAGTT